MPESKRPAKKKITAKKAAVKIPVEAKEEPKPVAKKAPAPKPTPKRVRHHLVKLESPRRRATEELKHLLNFKRPLKIFHGTF